MCICPRLRLRKMCACCMKCAYPQLCLSTAACAGGLYTRGVTKHEFEGLHVGECNHMRVRVYVCVLGEGSRCICICTWVVNGRRAEEGT